MSRVWLIWLAWVELYVTARELVGLALLLPGVLVLSVCAIWTGLGGEL